MSNETDGNKRKSPSAKSPGFWFFTGDWLKDPELRFCSIFARGLLVDLLCFMFESKERGYLIWPDGSPRSNEDIADAVSGGDRSDKVKAIEELERKGVLSRDSRGVLFSRRMARLGEISQMRSNAGSKPKTKQEQTPNKTGTKGEQKPGVTDTDSVSDSVNKTPLTPQGGGVVVSEEKPKQPEQRAGDPPPKRTRKTQETIGEFQIPKRLDTPEVRKALEDFETMRIRTGKRIRDRGNVCRGWDNLFVDVAHLLACIDITIANEWQGIDPKYVTAGQASFGRPERKTTEVPAHRRF
jgi:hypothetical protein